MSIALTRPLKFQVLLCLALLSACYVPPWEQESSGWEGTDAQDSSADDAGDEGPSGNDPDAVERCNDKDLEWKSARKTNYESYPDPNSPECIEFNGCFWEGLFAGCGGKKEESWVSKNNIAAVFPNFGDLRHHEICIKKGDRVMIVNVIDTCADSDCDGCCTRNQGSHDALVDLEKYTNSRWGLPDGKIEWADLGKAEDPICK